jgi:hypothetical protein
MGTVTRNATAPLMTACEVASYLLECCKSLHEFDSFMFGSSLFGVGNDFDILIVGACDESLSRLKTELRIAARELPLDVLYMLPAEAEVTEFVARKGCVPLRQLATSPKLPVHAKPRVDA